MERQPARILERPGGQKRIQFYLHGKRSSLSLGKITEDDANEVYAHFKVLLEARKRGREPKQSTAVWVSEQSPDILKRLIRAGLVDAPKQPEPEPEPEPEPQRETLRTFCDRHIESKAGAKPRSIDLMQRARDSLIKFFGADKALEDITVGDAKAWRDWLLVKGSAKGGKLGINTANGCTKKVKAFFNSAVDFRIIPENPFAKLPSTVHSNRSRMAYVSKADILKVIDQMPDAELQLLIALVRFAGLRNPSETLSLKWEHINFADDRMTIPSPKTAHHEGKAFRVVPIPADLRPFLDAAWEYAGGDSEYVITKWRSEEKNFRTRVRRAIIRAGLVPWPKTFVNLRSSCRIDWEEFLPSHVCDEWLGHSGKVASEFYLKPTDDHFAAVSTMVRKVVPSSPTRRRQRRTPPSEIREKVASLLKLVRDKYPRQDSNLRPAV